ncbi:MAG TPA: GNAT family N-acetyltransferase [Planctomycetes bacterium]|nr:GNAT family N-acetyltransferase [Planctomycetota bacterium]
MALAIRNLVQSDFSTLWKMDWSPLIKERDSIYLILAVDQCPVSFVAYDDKSDKWLGVLLATRSADGLACYINHLLVMPDARGMGIGSALVKRLAEDGAGLGIRKIWFFTSEKNRPFYEKLGFTEDFSFFDGPVKRYVQEIKNALSMSCTL